MHAPIPTALVPYLGPGDDGALAWLRLSPAERRRTAMQAAHAHDAETLWHLTEAWLRSFSPAGARISPATVRSYRTGLRALLVAWARQDLLRPDPDAPCPGRKAYPPLFKPLDCRCGAGRPGLGWRAPTLSGADPLP